MPIALRVSELTSASQADLTDSDLFLITDSEASASKKLTFANLKAKIVDAGISLSDLSVSSAAASGGGSLSYNNNGTFTFRPADVSDFLVTSDLSGFATETYVTNAISAIPATDLTGYATETYVNTQISNIPATDLTGYATENYVDTEIGNINIPSIAGLATETYVDTEIASLTLAGIAGITATPGVNQIIKWDGSNWSFAPDVDTNTQISTLGDIADVDLAGLIDGEVLTWNATMSEWVPSLPSNPSTSLTALTDVTISGTPTTGHVLKWDGSTWTPAADSGGGGGGGIALNDLSVVNNPVSGGSGALSYNNINGTFTFTQAGPPIASNFTWDSHLIPTQNATYDLGNAEKKVRHLFLSDNSIKFESGDLGIDNGKVIFEGDNIATEPWVENKNYLISTDLNGYATESYVTTAIGNIPSPTPPDLSPYLTIANAAATYALDSELTIAEDSITAIKSTVDSLSTTVNNLDIDIAPDTLNSINELAAALNDDPNIISSIETRVTTLENDTTGGGGGSSTLDGLTDVALGGTPDNGDVLKWNSASSKWTAQPDIDTDTNVDLTSVNNTLQDLSEFQLNLVNNTAVSGLGFTSNNTSGSSPLGVSLTLDVSGNPNQFVVDWGDGSSNTYTSQFGISHTYNQPSGGLNTISIVASNTNGSGFGSTNTFERADYITLYTPQPVPGFSFYNALSGGSALSGNNLFAIEGQAIYIENTTTNTVGATVTYEINWGDASFGLVPSNSDPGGVEGDRMAHTYTSNSGTGRNTVNLTLETHNTADPSVIPSQADQFLKVYAATPVEPDGIVSGILDGVSNTQNYRASLNFTDNTGGTTTTAGSYVSRVRTNQNSVVANMNKYTYNDGTGNVTALVNGSADGVLDRVLLDSVTTNGKLQAYDSADYQLLTSSGTSTSFNNSIYYPGLYDAIKFKINSNRTDYPTGLNKIQITDDDGGATNEVEFMIDDVTAAPTIDISSATVSELAAGNYRYISGIPYFKDGSPSVRVSGVKVSNFIGQTYLNSNPVTLQSGTNFESTSGSAISNKNFSYSDLLLYANGAALANIGTLAPYNVNNMDVNITTSNVRVVERLKLTMRNPHGNTTSSDFDEKVQVHTSSQYGISEIDIDVPSNLGNGAYTDGGVRVADFLNEVVDNPVINSGTNYYTNNPFTESADPGVEGSTEATLRLGKIEHNLVDYSTGFIPTGPDRSGDTGTQYFTFAFRRQVVANFDIDINTTGIAGLWVASPGTTIDNTSGLNGWLTMGASYAGSGVPGSNTGNGGNGSDGCAFNNSDVIPLNSSINTSYTVTLGEENMSNATGNVVLIRIALNAGQSISELNITEANT